MIKNKISKQVLTWADQEHLTICAEIHSMAAMKRHAENMVKATMDSKNPFSINSYFCYECWCIATKLGIIEKKEGKWLINPKS